MPSYNPPGHRPRSVRLRAPSAVRRCYILRRGRQSKPQPRGGPHKPEPPAPPPDPVDEQWRLREAAQDARNRERAEIWRRRLPFMRPEG